MWHTHTDQSSVISWADTAHRAPFCHRENLGPSGDLRIFFSAMNFNEFYWLMALELRFVPRGKWLRDCLGYWEILVICPIYENIWICKEYLCIVYFPSTHSASGGCETFQLTCRCQDSKEESRCWRGILLQDFAILQHFHSWKWASIMYSCLFFIPQGFSASSLFTNLPVILQAPGASNHLQVTSRLKRQVLSLQPLGSWGYTWI